LFFSGSLGGFLAGLLGIGGGPIYVVIFSHFISKLTGNALSGSDQVKLVIAHASFSKVFAALSGCIQQYRFKNFYPKIAIAIAIPAVILSVLLTEMLAHVNYSKTAFSIVFLVLLSPMLLKMLFDNSRKKQFNHPKIIKQFFLVFAGLISGTIAALSGLGGGLVMVPLLNAIFNIKIRKVISISLTVILMTSTALTLYYMLRFSFPQVLPNMLGAISFNLAIPVLLGVTLGAPLGVRASKRLSPLMLRVIFISVCSAVIAYTLYGMF